MAHQEITLETKPTISSSSPSSSLSSLGMNHQKGVNDGYAVWTSSHEGSNKATRRREINKRKDDQERRLVGDDRNGLGTVRHDMFGSGMEEYELGSYANISKIESDVFGSWTQFIQSSQCKWCCFCLCCLFCVVFIPSVLILTFVTSLKYGSTGTDVVKDKSGLSGSLLMNTSLQNEHIVSDSVRLDSKEGQTGLRDNESRRGDNEILKRLAQKKGLDLLMSVGKKRSLLRYKGKRLNKFEIRKMLKENPHSLAQLDSTPKDYTFKRRDLPKRNTRGVKVFMGILSKRDEFHLREAARRTWLRFKVQQETPLGFDLSQFDYRYFIEDPENVEKLAVLKEEAQKYNDLVIVPRNFNIPSGYKSIIFKVEFMMNFFVEGFRSTDLFIKSDTDAFWNIDRLFQMFNDKKRLNLPLRKSILGCMWSGKVEHHEIHKWNNDKYFYDSAGAENYFKYATGAGYILTRDVVESVVQTKNKVYYNPEDVTVSSWLKAFNIRWIHMNQMYFEWNWHNDPIRKKYNNDCCKSNVLALHPIKEERLIEIVDKCFNKCKQN